MSKNWCTESSNQENPVNVLLKPVFTNHVFFIFNLLLKRKDILKLNKLNKLMLCFKLQACRVLRRERVPNNSCWFQKATQVVTKAFKQQIVSRHLTNKSACLLSIGLIWHNHYARFSLSHLQPDTPEEFKAIFFSKCNFPYSHEPVTDPDYYQTGDKSSVS